MWDFWRVMTFHHEWVKNNYKCFWVYLYLIFWFGDGVYGAEFSNLFLNTKYNSFLFLSICVSIKKTIFKKNPEIHSLNNSILKRCRIFREELLDALCWFLRKADKTWRSLQRWRNRSDHKRLEVFVNDFCQLGSLTCIIPSVGYEGFHDQSNWKTNSTTTTP